ncbi:formate dehydrogenase gamma subunit [Panacagrimonas perspica]|uniref:NADH-quinone oxidoreductase subunit E n=1 Tax=Panacagrimonas perspica TaxID=381431 RepID=A0A4R7P2M8_9GAMM|nr:formate dehydrogenase subunit gamma [Panacagrimonas perspica]TDU27985.1 formate dehydrogenase gamma subunit [Panacagrimonas perspica]
MKQANRKVIPIQPVPGGNLPPEQRLAVQAAVQANRDQPGNLLLVLHAVQDRLGFVPPDAVALIAFELNLSRAEVHGVVSFYHAFRTAKPGRHVLHLCRAEACQSVGAAALEAHAKKSLGVDFHGTTADGAVTLEPVYCLGNCALGPALMIDDKLCGRVTPARFDQFVADMRA